MSFLLLVSSMVELTHFAADIELHTFAGLRATIQAAGNALLALAQGLSI